MALAKFFEDVVERYLDGDFDHDLKPDSRIHRAELASAIQPILAELEIELSKPDSLYIALSESYWKDRNAAEAELASTKTMLENEIAKRQDDLRSFRREMSVSNSKFQELEPQAIREAESRRRASEAENRLKEVSNRFKLYVKDLESKILNLNDKILSLNEQILQKNSEIKALEITAMKSLIDR